MEDQGLDMSHHKFNVVVPSTSEPASSVVLTSTPFRFTKRRLERDGSENQESPSKVRAVAGPAQKAFDKV